MIACYTIVNLATQNEQWQLFQHHDHFLHNYYLLFAFWFYKCCTRYYNLNLIVPMLLLPICRVAIRSLYIANLATGKPYINCSLAASFWFNFNLINFNLIVWLKRQEIVHIIKSGKGDKAISVKKTRRKEQVKIATTINK